MLVLLLSFSQRAMAQASDVLKNKLNYTVIPNGNGVFTIKIPAYVGGRGGNRWLTNDDDDYPRISVNDGTSTYDLVRIVAENWSNESSGSQPVSVYALPNMGWFSFTTSDGNPYECTSMSDWTKINSAYTKDITGEHNTIYLEFKWKADYEKFNAKKLKFSFHGNYDTGWGTGYRTEINYDMASYVYSSTMVPPTIANAYLNMDATEGQEGQVKVLGFSTTQPEKIELYVNDKLTLSTQDCGDTSFELTLGPSDTTRVVMLKGTYIDDGSVTTLNSKPFTIYPYHSITKLKVKEQHEATPQISSGNKEISWSINDKTLNDMYSGDVFVIERSGHPDMSNPVQVGSVMYNDTVSAGHYSFVDKSEGSLLNMNDPESDKLYYRVSRSSASSFFTTTDNAYAVTGEVKNECGKLPHVSSVSIIEDENFKNNRKIFVRSKLNLYGFVATDPEAGIDFYKAQWNDAASIKMVVNRYEALAASPLTADTLTLSNKDLVLDTENQCYTIDKSYVLTEPGMKYVFKTFVEIPSDAPYLKFYTYKTNPDPGQTSNAIKYTDISCVYNVTATQGSEYGFVRVGWELPGNRIDRMRLLRVEANGSHDNAKVIAQLDPSATYYEDHTAELGKEYEYAVEYFVNYAGYDYNTKSWDKRGYVRQYGWISPTGKITGRVVTSQNTGIGGQHIVVTAPDKTQAGETVTKADGTFELEGLPLSQGQINYTLQADDEHLTFTYNGEEHGAQIPLDAHNSLYEGVKFVCSSVERFSGRVLFENSTVPVAGASFLINNEPVYGSNGQVLTTDQNGNFEFTVPRHEVSVQVVKKGHRFDNNGYIVDKDNGNSKFTPREAYDGLTLYDQTKVLLRGRVIGGNTLAAEPLGQGLTQNNLGDSIVIQMKLEGNNTANIVYLKDRPEKDSLVVFNEQKWKGETVTQTRTDFYRKHFNIHVDNATGEYAVEVFPTKYKVVQAYAQGYASLFANGEVSQVIDLTDSVAVNPTQTGMATYSITYHSDVDITYKQLLWGQSEVDYLGAKEITVSNLEDKAYSARLAYPDEDGCEYLLGAPIYLSGTHYFLRGSAHEDYYYNNDKNKGDHFVEPLCEGKVTVVNGLTGSDPSTETFELDKNGQFTFSFVANNDNFALTGEDAMRTLNSNVELNGYHYQSEPIEAYVTGARRKDGDLFTAPKADIQLLDVLRDPPGASGSASYGKGKTYEMTRTLHLKGGFDFELALKKGTKTQTFVGTYTGAPGGGGGGFTGATNNVEADFETTITIPIFSLEYTRNASYEFTSKRKISTSGDPKDVGAMADVYIGYTSDLIGKTVQSICLIDSITYTCVKPSIDAGLIKLVKEGETPDGSKFYLVVADQIDPQYTMPSTFVYSQKHILTKVIPQLLSARNSLLVGGEGVTKDDVQAMATRSGKTLYYFKGYKEDKRYGVDYEPLYPNGIKPEYFIDDVAAYSNQIMKWINMIYTNEQLKVAAMATYERTNDNTFSISAGQNIEYSEEISYGELGYGSSSSTTTATILGMNTANMSNPSKWASLGTEGVTSLVNNLISKKVGDAEDKVFGEGTRMTTDELTRSLEGLLKGGDGSDVKNAKDAIQHTAVETPITKFTYTLKPVFDFEVTDDREGTPKKTFESGYELKLEDDSYLNFTVFRTPSLDETAMKTCKDIGQFVTKNDNYEDYLHQYIFVVNGGATRHPWMDADSTLFYIPGTPLGTRTQKICNPVMTIANPVVSNVPEDEKAVFQIKLSNDSEWTGNQKAEHVSILSLSLVDDSNENGAKISIDGMPLTDGRKFYIDPGESVTKTIEVARGVGYDFENLQLFFCCEEDERNSSTVNFSAHFLPSSSPVKIATPTDKWVMNTYSERDSVGYYMPVVIEGYDVNYNNFDHIELQYKKSTEGESGWTNICSYYADEDLYEAASGTKSKDQILTGRITHPFYGEKDPIEMKYDLRAVTFCRLGTGFVTKASNVISGTKDTRRPTIFGQSEPLNGILTASNSIVLPFSENIAYNYLDETSNFDVRGYTNSSDIDTNVGLVFTGEDGQDAYTRVTRNLANRDFTVDMLVQPAEDRKEMTFFSHGDTENGNLFEFGITAQRQLFANINGTVVKSKALSDPVNQDMTHVGVEFDMLDSEDYEGKATVHFFVGNSFVQNDTDPPFTCDAYCGNSDLHFGVSRANPATAPFEGRMLEVRLWNQALDADMVSAYNHSELNGYLDRIIGYWPMRQAEGDAKDEATGADLALQNVTWHTAKGHSLAIQGKGYALDGESFGRSANFDYTLAFWMSMQQAANNSYIFSAGNNELEEKGLGKLRIGFENEKFVVRSNGNTFELCDADMLLGAENKGQWHHFALSVSHSKNLAHIYLDGELVQQVQGDKVDGITMSNVRLGDEGMQANVDLLTFWRQALPQGYLQYVKNYRLSGDEMGLYIYLPFDEPQESTQGTLSDRFVVTNQAKDNMDIYKKTIVMGATDADAATINAPVLESLPLTKLKFSWASDGTKLLINLDMKDSEINNRNIFLTVRDVEDLNGNTMVNPYSWTIYTYRNILYWASDDQMLNLKQGESAIGDVEFINVTSKSVNYTVSTSSPYIKVSDAQGVTKLVDTNHLSYFVEKGMTPGNYVEYLWLHDDDNDMTSVLPLYITVEGEAPDWSVDRTKFDQTMTIIADVYNKVNGIQVLDNDTRDMVAVFAGSECVGVANISTNTDELSQLYLNVYGNSMTEGSDLDFYLWDYSEGSVTKLLPNTPVTFNANAMVGMPPAEPLKLVVAETEMQDIALQPGWNWIALNLMPLNGTSANTTFLSSRVFSNGDIIKDDSKHSEYSEARNLWMLDDISFSNKKVYRVYVHKATRANVLGTKFSKADCEMQIQQGWNELPYVNTYNMPIKNAMADFTLDGKATEGDILKGIESFAVLSKAYGWIGSLQTLEAGQGYYLYHTGQGCNFNFKANEADGSKKAASKAPRRAMVSENNMTVIAAFAEGEEPADDVVVEAYAGAELVGEATPVILPDGRKLYFITVASGAPRVRFVAQQPDVEPVTVGALPYNDTTGIGTIDSPFLLSTKITLSADDELYDLSGRRTNTKRRGIYVKKGMKLQVK